MDTMPPVLVLILGVIVLLAVIFWETVHE